MTIASPFRARQYAGRRLSVTRRLFGFVAQHLENQEGHLTFKDDSDRSENVARLSMHLPETGTSSRGALSTLWCRCYLNTLLSQGDLLNASKQPPKVRASSLFCYWAMRELGMTATAVAQKVGMTQPEGSRAVERCRGDIRRLFGSTSTPILF